MEQQTHVEHVCGLGLRQAHPAGQVGADQPGTHRRFHGQVVAKIGNDRKAGEQVGEAKPRNHHP